MGEAQRIEALRHDILDYQNLMGKAQDVKHYSAADVYQELIHEARRHIAMILNGGVSPLVV